VVAFGQKKEHVGMNTTPNTLSNKRPPRELITRRGKAQPAYRVSTAATQGCAEEDLMVVTRPSFAAGQTACRLQGAGKDLAAADAASP
jgi:hypothetical protein